MSECALLICNNIANALGGNVVESHYIDMIEPKEQKEADPEEIKERILTGLWSIGAENERI